MYLDKEIYIPPNTTYFFIFPINWFSHRHQNETLTGQKYFPTKIFPYIFHIKPLIFITFSWSHSLADFHEIFTFNSRIIIYIILLEFILISSCNFFEFLFTSIYDLNTNVNSWRHNFIWLYSKIWWKNLTLFLNQFLRESRNKIIWKLYKEETIFISTFNAENFLNIR